MSEPTPQIPGYTLQRLLGVGTSGRVYQAVRHSTGEAVAVKVLTRPFDPRFAREVAILQALEHPHILRIVDHGSSGGQAFLATELVTGASLRDVLLMRGLGPTALTQTVAKLAQALATAHARGVLHRDLKPANVLLDEGMQPRLVDFGLAAFADDTAKLTQSGSALGTPMYMAPEVLAGGAQFATEKADVYALGVILFEGLAAKHPFQGPDWASTRARVLAGQVPSLPQVADWLQAVCKAALARDPADRPTAAALARALLEHTDAVGDAAPPALPSAIRRGPGWRVGDRLGSYVLEELLGQGGMGTVFLGRHQLTHARHALKIVTAARHDRRQRFETEALALAKVDAHPGVVGIHQFEVLDSGESFFALDYVPGTDLEQALQRGPLAIDRALEIARQVAEALAYVHARGIVHRDLKPGNILLHADDGRALLADFGLALDPEAQRLTASNAILGTPCYMAPEQAEGTRGDVGPKADVFALGAVLYTMLVGSPPFQRAHFVDLLTALLGQEPTPPRHTRGEVSPALEELVLWCLEKDPQQRPDAQDLAQALAAVQRGERIPRGAGAWSRARRLARRVGGPRSALAAALCAVVLGSGGLAVALKARRQQRTAWERDARAAIASAESALARADQRSLPAFFDWKSGTPQQPTDWEQLQALDRLASQAQGSGSALAGEVVRLQASLRAARGRAQVDAALGAGDLDAASALLGDLSPAARTAYHALIQVRRGAPVDPERLLTGVERSPTWAADRLRLLAARVELDRGQLDAARALLRAVSSEYGSASARLGAEVCVREVLAATRRLDVGALQPALDEALALDPERGAAGCARAAAVALELWEAGEEPRALLPLLDALNGPSGRAPETAPVYVAAAVDAADSPGGEAGLAAAARALDRALRLNPRTECPSELPLRLSLYAGQLAARGELPAAARIFLVCTRSGMVLAPPQVQLSTTAAIYRSGVLEDILQADPNDWAALAWRGLGAYGAWKGGAKDVDPGEQAELARLAHQDLRRCLERVEVQGELRAELELLELSCLGAFDRQAFAARIEALEARGDYPELWRVYRIAVLAYQDGDAELELRFARRYVDALTRRVEATAQGRLAPGERGADSQRLGSAYGALISSLIRSGLHAEARNWLARADVRSALAPEDARELQHELEGH